MRSSAFDQPGQSKSDHFARAAYSTPLCAGCDANMVRAFREYSKGRAFCAALLAYVLLGYDLERDEYDVATAW